VTAIVLLRRGERWRQDAPLGEQEGVSEHIGHLAALGRSGVVVSAGPFHEAADLVEDELVGLVICRDRAGAEQLVQDDPAVRLGVLSGTIHPWHR